MIPELFYLRYVAEYNYWKSENGWCFMTPESFHHRYVAEYGCWKSVIHWENDKVSYLSLS